MIPNSANLRTPLSNLTFNAIDVETANASPASICQIGIVYVRDGVIRGPDVYPSPTPKSGFNLFNVRLHGINEETVKDSPTFPRLYSEICHRLSGQGARKSYYV